MCKRRRQKRTWERKTIRPNEINYKFYRNHASSPSPFPPNPPKRPQGARSHRLRHTCGSSRWPPGPGWPRTPARAAKRAWALAPARRRCALPRAPGLRLVRAPPPASWACFRRCPRAGYCTKRARPARPRPGCPARRAGRRGCRWHPRGERCAGPRARSWQSRRWSRLRWLAPPSQRPAPGARLQQRCRMWPTWLAQRLPPPRSAARRCCWRVGLGRGARARRRRCRPTLDGTASLRAFLPGRCGRRRATCRRTPRGSSRSAVTAAS